MWKTRLTLKTHHEARGIFTTPNWLLTATRKCRWIHSWFKCYENLNGISLRVHCRESSNRNGRIEIIFLLFSNYILY